MKIATTKLPIDSIVLKMKMQITRSSVLAKSPTIRIQDDKKRYSNKLSPDNKR